MTTPEPHFDAKHLTDIERAALTEATTPEPVSPAPDTEALRQRTAEIASEYLHACPHCPADTPEWVVAEEQLHEIVGRVVAEREASLRADLSIRYRALAAALGVPRDADEVAGYYGAVDRVASLRADLDRARAEVERLTEDRDALGDAQRRTRRALLPILTEHPLTRYAVASPEVKTGYVAERTAELLRWYAVEVERLTLELQAHQVDEGYEKGVQAGLAAGARPIPDDAAAQIAQCLSDYWISLRGRRQDADETEHGQAEDVDRLVRSWLAPITGPAPAAADATAPYRELLGAIWLYVKWHYVTKQLTTEQKELWADAVDAFAEPQEGKAERWWREPAAPQAPAEPKKQCAWWWDTKQCPDWAAPGGKYCNGHQRDHNDLLRVVPEAAREDTAPPAWTGHTVEVTSNKDDLHDVACTSGCGWLGVCISEQGANDLADRHRADTLRPSAPTEEV